MPAVEVSPLGVLWIRLKTTQKNRLPFRVIEGNYVRHILQVQGQGTMVYGDNNHLGTVMRYGENSDRMVVACFEADIHRSLYCTHMDHPLQAIYFFEYFHVGSMGKGPVRDSPIPPTDPALALSLPLGILLGQQLYRVVLFPVPV